MDDDNTSEGRPKSRRPKDTKFKQQKLPAWQPVMTANTVLPAFIGIGLVFIPLGIGLLVTSNGVQEIVIDYTTDECRYVAEPGGSGGSSLTDYTCDEFIRNNTGQTCKCTIQFKLTTNLTGEVYMYYGLTNYYQNHRRYVRSRDDEQLLGADKLTANSLSSDCTPYRGLYNDSVHGDQGVPYAPCGAIANSLFNDTLKIALVRSTTGSVSNQTVGLINTGIAWNTDRNSKFHNPKSWTGTLQPPFWNKTVDELDPSNPSNNGYENEDLIVWMRTAALPTFRKFYRIVNRTGVFSDGLLAGDYVLNIDYAYPVTQFGGRKQMILTTTSWLGGKNPFLGTAYIVVGSLSMALGIGFFLVHLKVGKRPLELIHDVDSRTAY